MGRKHLAGSHWSIRRKRGPGNCSSGGTLAGEAPPGSCRPVAESCRARSSAAMSHCNRGHGAVRAEPHIDAPARGTSTRLVQGTSP
jgi:hypothetical protein